MTPGIPFRYLAPIFLIRYKIYLRTNIGPTNMKITNHAYFVSSTIQNRVNRKLLVGPIIGKSNKPAKNEKQD